ncbi:MAG: iron ABC transporter permease [Anaerotignum sp.]|nr:iron ABC transporter permease [Anaerotignum sp.]
MKKNSKIKNIILLMTLVLLAEFILSLFVGKYPLSFEGLMAGEEQAMRVFMTLRLPRTCMAVLAGFGLGVAGMVYQTVFRNPLASPDIIGVSSGASAGAAFAILFLTGSAFAVMGSAFLGSMIAVALVLALTSIAPEKGNASIVLAGIAIHSLAQTILMVLKLSADPEKELASIEYWIMGSLNGITLDKLPVPFVLSVLCMIALFLLHRQVLLLSVEEYEAALLGVAVEKMRLCILLLATLVVAATVSVTGIISFVGLLAPHCARLLTKDNRIYSLWLSGLLGGSILCMADILARSAAASELPVSVFTSLLGAPFLIWLLLRRRDENV